MSLMQKWAVDVMSGDPFEGTTMYFYADDAELLLPMERVRAGDSIRTVVIIAQTLEITANGAKFNFGVKRDDGCFTNLRKDSNA